MSSQDREQRQQEEPEEISGRLSVPRKKLEEITGRLGKEHMITSKFYGVTSDKYDNVLSLIDTFKTQGWQTMELLPQDVTIEEANEYLATTEQQFRSVQEAASQLP